MTKRTISSLIIAALLIISGYTYIHRPQTAFPGVPAVPAVTATETAPTSTPTTYPAQQLPDGRMQYRNDFYKFDLKYPANLQTQEYAEPGGGRTLIFQDPVAGEGFQIYIVPYNGTQITEERFKQDEPSGVQKNLHSGLLSGVPAASFYSSNISLGDTYEVWFIHGGYLFEVTTLQPLDSWLQSILKTWAFSQ